MIHTGKAFLVKDKNRLTNEIIPYYFRHNNYDSLMRSLNVYKFKKSKVQLSGTRDHWCHRFEHAYFVQGRPDLLVNIHLRKTPAPRGSLQKAEVSNEVIIENRLLKARTQSMEHTISSLQAELDKLRSAAQRNQVVLHPQRHVIADSRNGTSAQCCPHCGQALLAAADNCNDNGASNRKRKAGGNAGAGEEADAADACVQLIKLSRTGA